jgi:energy-coupling factor transport system substrate-specific component
LKKINSSEAGLIAFGAAFNVSIGYLVSLIKLPLYLDSIGTVLIAALVGWRAGVLTGLAAVTIMSLTVVPTVFAYAGTAVVIALLTALLVKYGFLKNWKMTIFGGLILGLSAVVTSVPVTTFLYGGVSLAGSDAITTFFRTTGMSVWESVLLGGMVTDPADKLITSVICFCLLRSMPEKVIEKISGASK